MSELDLSKPGAQKLLAASIKEDINNAALAYDHNDEPRDEGFRQHLGASIIGDSCYRKSWFNFRWAYKKPIEGRQQRLFDRGHEEEARFTRWLRRAEHTVIDRDPATGKQWRVNGIGGHFGGSQDAEIILAPKYNYTKPVLGEYKTNGTGAVFQKLLTSGVAIGKPVHTDQMDVYGYYKNYEYALYLNVCKNDDDLHSEIVKLDRARGEKLEQKARVIILSQLPPPRIAENPAAQACQYCDYKEVCYGRQPLEHNCRACKYASPDADKAWKCGFYNATIPADVIPNGCENWQSIYRL